VRKKESAVAEVFSRFPPALCAISLKAQGAALLSPKAVDKSVDELWQTRPKPRQSASRLILPKNEAYF
jgi:hypothetical protein